MKNKGLFFKKVVAVLTIATLLGVPAARIEKAEAAVDYSQPRSQTDTLGNVYLGGKYIEVGVSPHGSFGATQDTSVFASAYGFHSAPSKVTDKNKGRLGLYIDDDGWGTGSEPATGDFFTPGSEYEFWGFEYKIGSSTYTYRVCDLLSECTGTWNSKPVASNTSSGNTLSAHVVGTTTHNVVIEIDYTFDVNDKQYLTTVTVKNNGSQKITDVYFQRGLDPDQDQWLYNTFNTYNKLVCNPVSTEPGGSKNYSLVVAYGGTSKNGFFFMSFDNRARALSGGSASEYKGSTMSTVRISSLWSKAPVTTKTYGEESDIKIGSKESSADKWMTMCTKLNGLAVGESDSTQYYSSLEADVLSSVEKVKAIAAAAEANVSSTELSVKLIPDTYFALFTKDGTKVHDWILAEEAASLDASDDSITVDDTTITFTGLSPDTEYTIRTLPKEEYLSTDEDKNIEDSTPSDVRTAIDPLGGSEEEYHPVITSNDTSITITGADPSYSYILLTTKGTVVKPYTAPIDGTVVFTGLSPDTEYIVKAKSAENDASEATPIKTQKNGAGDPTGTPPAGPTPSGNPSPTGSSDKDPDDENRQYYVSESVINYTDGYLHYNAENEHILMYAYPVDPTDITKIGTDPNKNIYIDLTAETFTSDFQVYYYSINGGVKWTQLKKPLDTKTVSKWFSKNCTIYITDKYDKKAKKLADDATVYYLGKLNKRPALSSLKVNYKLACDEFAFTTGQWVLTDKNGVIPEGISGYEFMVKNDVAATFAGDFTTGRNGKVYGTSAELLTAVNNTWGVWPKTGGVWVPTCSAAGKTLKAKIEVRIAAQADTGNGYTPASKVKKVNISSVSKAPKQKVTYTKETLKLKKNMTIFFGPENALKQRPDGKADLYMIRDLTKLQCYDDFAGDAYFTGDSAGNALTVDLHNYLSTDRHSLIIWQNATDKKPASLRQTILLAARSEITTDTAPKPVCKTGKARLPKGYEAFNTLKGKWGTSIAVPTETTVVQVRIKSTAKGGKETETYDKFATSDVAYMVLFYGIYDTRKDKSGVVDATIFATEAEALAAVAAYNSK